MENLFTLQPALQGASVAARRIIEILDLDLEDGDEGPSIVLDAPATSIEFRSVCFRYGTRRDVLNDVSFSLTAGQRVGIVGTTGSGKSTIVKLLLKMYAPGSGGIYLNGVDLRDLDTSWIRSIIGYVPQDVTLFDGTVAENIALHSPETSFEGIVQAAKTAQAHDFIMSMPDRYFERVSERGSTLSGGERQRIAFARAILGSPQVLVLDEATSALDTVTEKALQSALEELSCQGITVLIVAHRLSTVRPCDTILVLEKGNLVESGVHEQLITGAGPYATLWRSQIGV